MKRKKTGLLFLVASGVLATAFSPRRGGKEPRVSLHPQDLPPHQELGGRRTWRSAGHLLHHLRELSMLSGPLARTYLLRGIDPAFRERVMLVTAMANDCSW